MTIKPNPELSEFEYFEYKDIDYLQSPYLWLEVRLSNRLYEGFEIWRDHKNMSWRGIHFK